MIHVCSARASGLRVQYGATARTASRTTTDTRAESDTEAHDTQPELEWQSRLALPLSQHSQT